MLRKAFVDFNHVEEKHKDIHDRLVNWARWCRATSGGRGVHPMFKWCKSPQHWEAVDLPPQVDPLDAVKLEKAVAQLPEKHRFAVRWCYVHGDSPKRACQQVGESREGLYELIREGRQMLINRGV